MDLSLLLSVMVLAGSLIAAGNALREKQMHAANHEHMELAMNVWG